MANRTAAEIFSIAFKACAEEVDAQDGTSYRIAMRMWAAQADYDFTEDQMGCDKALLKLGFAKKMKEMDSEDSEYIVYLKPDGEYR